MPKHFGFLILSKIGRNGPKGPDFPVTYISDRFPAISTVGIMVQGICLKLRRSLSQPWQWALASVLTLLLGVVRVSKAESTFHWEELEAGLSLGRVSVGSSEMLVRPEVVFLRVEPKSFDLSLVQARDFGAKRLDIKTLTTNAKAIAGINAHFFGYDGLPLGLIVHQGKTINPLHTRGSVLTGVFSISSGKARIYHRNGFRDPSSLTLALQSGPRLLVNGAPTPLKNGDNRSRRSGIAVTRDGSVLIFATRVRFPGMTFKDLQALLQHESLGIVDALNLDGGGSSQFYLSPADNRGELYFGGNDPIPVALVVSHPTKRPQQ